MKKISISESSLKIFWVLVVGVLGRLVTPLPNFTPMTGLSLFAGGKLKWFGATLLVLTILFFSDLCLSFMRCYPLCSYFTIFTNTGFMLESLIGLWIKKVKWGLPLCIVGASTIFWLWTNFGVWLTSGLYPKTTAGLLMCYQMALPFLRNAMLGDLIWSGFIFGVFYLISGVMYGVFYRSK